MKAVKTESVPALTKAFRLLDTLSKSTSGMTLAELVARSQLPKSTVHCLLLTLHREGYIHHNQKIGRYMFGQRLSLLANASIRGLELREEAAPYLAKLMLDTQLTVHMGIMEHGEGVVIAKIACPAQARLATWIGKRVPLHCTGLGKALLSGLNEEELDLLSQTRGLSRHNDSTIGSVARLKKDLERVRTLGYAIDDEEDEIGMRCIGVPVLNSERNVTAAISVAGTTHQITSENELGLSQKLKRTAAAVSQFLAADSGHSLPLQGNASLPTEHRHFGLLQIKRKSAPLDVTVP